MTTPTHNTETIPDTVAKSVDYLEQALLNSDVFFGHGCIDAYDEAVYLVLHSLGLPLDELEPYLNTVLSFSQKETLAHFLQMRISKRLPIPYLTKEAWLMGRKFYVDERVIVPRSFIAEILPDGLATWLNDGDNVTNILDMCTGSGCLAIIAAEEFPQAQVDAVDISAEALQVAQHNIATYALESAITTYQSDLFSNLPKKHYDLILCNPPYVNQSTMEQLPSEYLHEPQLALAGGLDGMDLIRRLLKEVSLFLKPQGILVLEIGNERTYFEQAFPALNPVWLSCSAGDDQVLLLSTIELKKLHDQNS